jgi:hypothetical protein
MAIENQVPITIQRTDLVVLDEVILAATTSEAYDIISSGTVSGINGFSDLQRKSYRAPWSTNTPCTLSRFADCADPGLITSHFLPQDREPVIIRYDQVYNIKGPSGQHLPVKVLMCNSVLQGIMEEETSIIFTDMAGQSLETSNGLDFFESAVHNSHLSIFDDSSDPFEFDGDFIASRFLSKDHNGNSKNAFKDLHFSVAELEDDDEDEEDEEDNNNFSDVMEDSGDEIDGRKIHRDLGGQSRLKRTLFSHPDPAPEAEQPVKKTSVEFSPWVQKSHYPSHKLSPQPAPEDDPEARIMVDVSQLGKLRVFSGDWVGNIQR